jgi:hypothetical protein
MKGVLNTILECPFGNRGVTAAKVTGEFGGLYTVEASTIEEDI